MRKILLFLSFFSLIVNSSLVLASEVTIEKTKTEKSYSNPVAEVILLPVRVVGGVIGAPIGAVTGMFSGFIHGFSGSSHADHTETTKTTTTTTD
ncbi:MAG: hypothetical protein K2X01_00350 [Cyanobacteria bacterium]|nr:hypothetical protein [Cyanobacteriota bacterium]